MRLRRPTVVGQRIQFWIRTGDIGPGAGILVDGRKGGVLDQIETIRLNAPVNVGSSHGTVTSDDRALESNDSHPLKYAAAHQGIVSGDRAIADGQRTIDGPDAASDGADAGAGLVTADGAVSHRHRAEVEEAGAGTSVAILATQGGRVAAVAGMVAADCAVDQIQSSMVGDAAAAAALIAVTIGATTVATLS